MVGTRFPRTLLVKQDCGVVSVDSEGEREPKGFERATRLTSLTARFHLFATSFTSVLVSQGAQTNPLALLCLALTFTFLRRLLPGEMTYTGRAPGAMIDKDVTSRFLFRAIWRCSLVCWNKGDPLWELIVDGKDLGRGEYRDRI
jgi:hypothetical protein